MKLMFGKHKGKELAEVPTEYLMWLAETSDVNDPKYGPKNQLMVAACNNEVNRRGDSGAQVAVVGRGPQNPWRQQPKELPTIQLEPKKETEVIKEIRTLIDDLYKHASHLQRLFDEYTDKGVSTRDSARTPF